jgi:hypothetical protein
MYVILCIRLWVQHIYDGEDSCIVEHLKHPLRAIVFHIDHESWVRRGREGPTFTLLIPSCTLYHSNKASVSSGNGD